MAELTLQEPQGIEFFSINDGTSHFAKLEPTIAAYINSSDLGINASRGQDFGWRLGKAWVKRVRDFRRDATQMQILTAQNQGQKPTTVQILYYLYAEELRAYYEELEEHEHPFEEQYQNDISDRNLDKLEDEAASEDSEEVSEIVSDDDLEPSEDENLEDAAAEVATSEPQEAPKNKGGRPRKNPETPTN